MITRMQQRRGTDAQWDTANPILASGEIGVSTDSYQFKIGDGFSTWSELDYFQNFTQLGDTYATIDDLEALIDMAPETLDTLAELAAAINDDPDFFNTIQGEIDTKVALAGDTMTGHLTLNADPTEDLHAATKQYVDGAIDDLDTDAIEEGETNLYFTTERVEDVIGDANIDDLNDVNTSGVADGDALVYNEDTSSWIPGVLTSSLEDLEDTNVSGVSDGEALVYDEDSGFWVPGTLSSSLAELNDVDTSGVVDKNALVYSEALGLWIPGEGGGKFTVSDTAPEDPENGDTWFDSTTGRTYIYYEEDESGPSGSSQWVEIGSQPTGYLGLNELNDVDTSGVLNGNALVYDATQSKWVPGEGGGGASFTVSETEPSDPENGDVWFNSVSGKTYIYYEDDDSSQWVEIASQTTGFNDLDELNDVEVSGSSDGDFLRYNAGSGNWENDDYTDPIKLNEQLISANFTIPVGYNGLSAGPVTIDDGVTVTVSDGSAWSIV